MIKYLRHSIFKKERFILLRVSAHDCSWVCGSRVYRVAEKACSSHGGWEAKKEGERGMDLNTPFKDVVSMT
jgi:hypothetical protein